MHTLRGSEEKSLITAVMDVRARTSASFTSQDLLTPQNSSLVEKLRSFYFSFPIELPHPHPPPAANFAIPPHALHRAGAGRRQVERREDRAVARRRMTTLLSLLHAADPAGPLQMVAIFHHAKSLIPVAWSTPISETKELHML